MARKLLAASFVLILIQVTTPILPLQAGEHDDIKAAVLNETEAWIARDAPRFDSAWLHDPLTTRTDISANGYHAVVGWDNFGPGMLESMKPGAQPFPRKASNDNFVIHSDGTMAWVEYDQTWTSDDKSLPASKSRERRLLVKRDGQWKIAALITVNPDSFVRNTKNVINRLRMDAFVLMQDGKKEESLEVLKVCERLDPDSLATHVTLGRAYSEVGSKELAIEHLEKALKVAPDNEFVKAQLERVKKPTKP